MKRIKTTLLTALFLAGFAQMTCAQHRVAAKFVSGTPGGGNESAEMVADGFMWTKWCIQDAQQMPYFIVLDAGKSINLSAYGMVTGDDTHNYPDRNPLSWNVYGSNDNKQWTLCAQMKRDRKMSDENEQEYIYETKDAPSYRYYKFEFTKMTAGSRIQLSEINLYSK